jgi:hypothetical protein
MRRALGNRLGSRLVPVVLLALAPALMAQALSIRIAPLVAIGPSPEEMPKSFRPEEDLLEKLGATPLTGNLEFSPAEKMSVAPVSFLDAARLCELHEYPFLIYGYVRKRESIYTAELKLISREGKHIAASFLATDDEKHYERLVADLAGKIADYFLEDLAIAGAERPEDSVRNLFEIPFAAGYWAPVGEWSDGMMGIVRLGLGLRFVPRKPLAGIKSRPFYLGIGLQAEYALGKNLPEYETAYLHRIQARLPLELLLKIGGRSRLGLGLGGLMEFDLLKQERKYGEAYVETRSAGGIMASLEYRYALSERVAFGLDFEFDGLFYSHPLYTLSPKLSFEYSFAKRHESE